MILITGATGNLGKATMNSLLNNGISANNIAVLVRNEFKSEEFKSKGIQVRIGDYNDIDALKSAFADVDKLLLISSSSDIKKRFEQHQNVIDAAKETGVSHIVYTSFDMKDLRGSDMAADVQYHADTSYYLKQKGVTYTLLNNTLYADLIPVISGNNILTEGITIPAGNGKTPFLPITEMAEAITVVLTNTGHENKEYVIAAETALSFAEIAEIISQVTGTSVAYNQTDKTSYIKQLVQVGVSQKDAAYLSRFADAIANGEFDTNHSDIGQLLGRSSMPLKDFLRSKYGHNKA